MADLRKHSSTSNIIRFTLKHSTSGIGLTGLSSASSGLIISTICDNEATSTTYTVAGSTIETITTLGTFAAPTATKCRFKEVDATNHKGLYEFQFADARFSVASAKRLVISVTGATNLLDADYEIQLVTFDMYTAIAQTGDTFALANGANGFVAIKGDTTAILDDTGTTGVVFLDVNKVTCESGQAQGGSANKITLRAAASATNDLWQGQKISIYAGTGCGQTRGVANYNGTTKELTVARNWIINPDATSMYRIEYDFGPKVNNALEVTVANAGADLTAIPWNAAWDAEVQSECTDALNVYDPPTNAEMEARTPTVAELAYIVNHAKTAPSVTFTGGTTTTAILGNVDGVAASSTNDFYNGRVLIFNAGTLDEQATDITDYDGATKTATITAVTTAVTAAHTAIMV